MISNIPSIVFLDRDGTIIEDTHFIRHPDSVRLLPGAGEAIASLNRAGIPVVVATNQSGIARGFITEAEYHLVRKRMEEALAEHGAKIDASYFCPHHPDISGPCECRKPGTKMFRDAFRDFDVLPAGAAYIGDRLRDVTASKELGGRGILIPSPMTSDDDKKSAREAGIEIAFDLQEAVGRILTLTERAPEK